MQLLRKRKQILVLNDWRVELTVTLGVGYGYIIIGVRTYRRQTLRRQCRTFRRHIQLHKDRIPRHRHPRRHPREVKRPHPLLS